MGKYDDLPRPLRQYNHLVAQAKSAGDLAFENNARKLTSRTRMDLFSLAKTARHVRAARKLIYAPQGIADILAFGLDAEETVKVLGVALDILEAENRKTVIGLVRSYIYNFQYCLQYYSPEFYEELNKAVEAERHNPDSNLPGRPTPKFG